MFGIRQILTATNQFGGVAPATAETYANNLKQTLTSATGGLFTHGRDVPVQLVQFHLMGGGQSSWTLTLVYADTTTGPVVYSGTTGDTVKLDGAIWILPGQTLKLVTVGATTAMSAACYFE